MVLRRTNRTSLLKVGKQYGTSEVILIIREAVENGALDVETKILQENERLDIIAGQKYGDSTLYWVIAAASGIGFSLQVPPGSRLKIPKDINEVAKLVG